MLAATPRLGGTDDFVMSEGLCSEGANFSCGPRGGIFSCRPCDFPELAAFQDLQRQANRMARFLELDQGLLLKVDGRIGPKTTRTVGLVGAILTAPVFLEPAPAAAIIEAGRTPERQATIREISRWASVLQWMMKERGDRMGARAATAPPEPAEPPPGKGELPGKPRPDIGPAPIPEGRASGGKVALALGITAALGLTGAGIYYARKRA